MEKKRVLVVDHEPQRRANLKGLLEERRIEVLEATSCEEAVQELDDDHLDLVLTETELPGKSGLYLLRQIKECVPDLEVVLITHNASSYNVLQALRNGAYDFIVRPIDTGEILFSALDRAFAHIEMQQQGRQAVAALERDNRSLRRELRLAKALHGAVERLTEAVEIEDLFRELLSSAMRELHAGRAFLALYDRGTGRLGLKVCNGIEPEVCRRYAARLPAGITSALARHGEPVVVSGAFPQKLQRMAAVEELQDLYAAPGLLAAPLRLKNRVAGVVVLSGNENGQRYGEAELDFLVQLSRHAAIALEKAGIIHQLKRSQTVSAA